MERNRLSRGVRNVYLGGWILWFNGLKKHSVRKKDNFKIASDGGCRGKEDRKRVKKDTHKWIIEPQK